MMMMYFHGGYSEVILFDFWRISTLGGLIGSMIGCFLMGILYEGVKSYREYWMNGAFHAVSYNQVHSWFIIWLQMFIFCFILGTESKKITNWTRTKCWNSKWRCSQWSGMHFRILKFAWNCNSILQGSVKVIETKMWSLAHFVLTILHMVQMTLAYFLMLIVMTYNSWLCASVVVGSTVGYFLFGWRKTTIVDVSDHCHWRLLCFWEKKSSKSKIKLVWNCNKDNISIAIVPMNRR